MKAVIQRVSSAKVEVDGELIGSCGHGLLILLGVAEGDTEADLDRVLQKIVKLRIFSDENGKMNRSVQDIDGEMLVISQFTLYGSCKRGRRPDFLAAARPETAIPLYEKFVARCAENGFRVETGEFGADMKVDSLNDGPLTLILDTDQL